MNIVRLNLSQSIDTQFSEIKTEDINAIVKEAIAIAEIPSPTFHEEVRAQYVLERLKAMAVGKVQIIGHNNVLVTVGKGKGPLLLLAAHLDTVFPLKTTIKIRKEEGVLVGPGIGDNAVAIAAGLYLFERLKKYKMELSGTLIFAATTCEEGSGSLRGIGEVTRHIRQKIDYALALEGLFQGRLAHQAIGSDRWEVQYQGPGGHSWEDSGAPNPNHALVKLGYFLVSLRLPPMTTLNLSIIEGGRSINSISTSARVSIDIRSLKQAELRRLSAIVKNRAKEIGKEDKVKMKLTLIGKRPAGQIGRAHQLVRLGKEIQKHLGIQSDFAPMSTDANMTLAKGIPSLAIGISKGGNCHREDEYLEIASIRSGLKQIMLFVTSLIGMDQCIDS